MADITDLTLKEILHPSYHWTTRRGFWPHTLRIFCIAFGVVVAGLAALSAVDIAPLKIWLASNIWHLLLLPFVVVIFYWLIFWASRTWWKVIFSKKVNVVFAYNFAATPELEAEYDVLIRQLKQQIAEGNLGGTINVIKKPVDVEFKNKTAAEAKTKLGLRGSTLIIWGHPQKTRKGTKLFTLFSYEFSYPNFLSAAYARSVFGRDIQRGLDSGLFGVTDFSIGVQGDMFGEYTIDTISFILGMMAASYGNGEKALLFFEEFRIRYSAQKDPARKKSMGPAMGEVERSLVRIKVGIATQSYEQKNYQEMWRHLEDALAINRYDYFGNMAAALYWETVGDRAQAKHFTQMAEMNHPPNQYEFKFNKAYVALDEGQYRDAVAIYDDLAPTILANPNHMVTFFYNKYRVTKNPVFLFGEGVIGINWQDKKSGKKVLRDFVRRAKSIDEGKYKVLIDAAEKMLVI